MHELGQGWAKAFGQEVKSDRLAWSAGKSPEQVYRALQRVYQALGGLATEDVSTLTALVGAMEEGNIHDVPAGAVLVAATEAYEISEDRYGQLRATLVHDILEEYGLLPSNLDVQEEFPVINPADGGSQT